MVCLNGRETAIHLVIQGNNLRIVLHFIENIPTVQLCPVSKYPPQDSSRSFTSSSAGFCCSLLHMGNSMKPTLSAKQPIYQSLPGSAAAFPPPVECHGQHTDETGNTIAFQRTGVTLRGKLSFDCTTEIPKRS